MSKHIGRASIVGEQGIAHIRRVVLDMGYMFYETGGVEAGIDGYIELRDQHTGKVSNLILQVQGKATERERLPAETSDSFEWPCSEADIKYWLHGTAPVLLIVVQTTTNRAYWKSIKDYFGHPRTSQRRCIVFDKSKDIFNLSAKTVISTIAASVRPGAIGPPTYVGEHLATNLVPIERFGPRLFLAETEHRSGGEFHAASRRLVIDAPSEWIVKNGHILSFHDLHSRPWCDLCEVGTIESFDVSEWALASDFNRQRDFVQLLNRALVELTRSDLVADIDRHIFYFRPPEGKTDRSFSYRAFAKQTARNVVKFYRKKKLPREIAYCRHSAFIGRFQCFDDRWYLEITPTYHFTRDGRWEDRFASERLKGIKELENNSAVLGQFAMWQHYLVTRVRGNMFTPEYPFIKFGVASDLAVEQGVPDKLWLSGEPVHRMPLFEENASD